MCVGNFEPLMPIISIRYTKSESNLFLYTMQKSLILMFKPRF